VRSEAACFNSGKSGHGDERNWLWLCTARLERLCKHLTTRMLTRVSKIRCMVLKFAGDTECTALE
jgi:hypothetical protein